MENLKDRMVANVSTAELERRWKAARTMMEEHKVDLLLMRQDEEYYGGHVRWFTGIAPRHSYPLTVIFPVNEDMTTIMSSPPANPSPPVWAVRGIKRRLGAPYYPSLHYTATYDAELAAGVLAERKGATVGIVGRLTLHLPFYEYLTRHLPDIKFVDVTDGVDYLRAVKSPEEIELIKGTAALQDRAMVHLKKTIKPGMRELDIHAEADYVSTKGGSTRLQVLISSYQPGEEPVRFQGRHYMNRVLREGDQVVVLLEGNGPGGYYTEISRIFYLLQGAVTGDEGDVRYGARGPKTDVKPPETGCRPQGYLGCEQRIPEEPWLGP